MGDIAESAKWIDNIYRTQKTDPVLGGQDGIINIQPEQIACRTLFLKKLLELQHNEDGSHKIVNANVADNAGIPESKLALDVSTDALYSLLVDAENGMRRLQDDVEKVLGENGFLVHGLAKAAQLNWLYGQWGCAFEFFRDNLTMRDVKNVDARRIIGRDDSIDCADTTGFMPGMRLLVSNGEQREEVIIRSVLENGRIRLMHDLSRTYEEPATIGYTDWDLSNPGKAVANKDCQFFSRDLDLLENCGLGMLLVCREKGEGKIRVDVRETEDNLAVWHAANLVDTFAHDKNENLVYERYEISGVNVQLRITGITDEPVVIRHLALFPDPSGLMKSSIRTPHVVYPESMDDLWQDLFAMESSQFYAAYKDFYVQTEYGFFDPETKVLKYLSTALTTKPTVFEDMDPAPEPGDYILMCRHQSDMGEWSFWSEPIMINVKPTRILFGLSDPPKSGGFADNVPFDRLGVYPLHFGFVGARLSGGFDEPKIKFAKKLED